MTNENNAQPAVGDVVRSVLPYLLAKKSKLAGTVSIQETDSGLKFAIYTPPDYDSSLDNFPILYHLHGAGMFWSWVHKELHWIAAAHEQAVQHGQTRPMVIVSPYDASKFSMWADSMDESNKMASALHDDLIPYVEQNYKIIGDRASRFIQGFSMGGFGAASHAFRHQDLFAAVVVWDGAMHNWATITATRPSIVTNQFADSETAFNKWSPWAAAEQADLSLTPIIIVSGLMVDFAERYTAFLEGLGAQVTLYREDCLHDMKCLEATRGQAAFAFFGEMMARQYA
ncbi:MAG: alpha/beta hydrolase-fold protein [Chloroflexota bacterium]